MPFRHDAGIFRPNGVSRRTLNGMKTPNPRCFGVWGVIGKKVEAKNPNGVSAKCAIYGDVRIGLTLYSSSCSTRYELNFLLGRKKMSVGKKSKNVRKKKCFVKNHIKGSSEGPSSKGRPQSQLRVPTCGGMSTDGPQPTQGHLKKKKSRSVVFWDCFFVPCFLFLFFWRPLG